jgi:hypothetical protein
VTTDSISHPRANVVAQFCSRLWRCGLLAPDRFPHFLSYHNDTHIFAMYMFYSKNAFTGTELPDHTELCFLARQAVIASGHAVSPTFPSRGWLSAFLTRHKAEVSMRRAQILSVARFLASHEDTIRMFHDNLNAVIMEQELDSTRVWNCDEAGFNSQGNKTPRVVCPKGMRANIVRSSDKENVSVMLCVSACGDWIPLLFIFAGVLRHYKWLDGAMEGSTCAMSDSSYINGKIFGRFALFNGEVSSI